MGTWLRRRLSLKGRVGLRRETCMSFPWSFTDCLYSPCPRALGRRWSNPSPNCFGEVEARWTCPSSTSLPDLESHWLTEILIFLGRSLMRDTVWGQKVKKAFSRLKFNRKAESYCWPSGEASFFFECRKAVAERTSYFCLVRKLIWPLWSSYIFTQWGWLILFSPDHFPGQHENGESPPPLPLPWALSSRTDVLSVRSLHSNRITTPWGKLSNL